TKSDDPAVRAVVAPALLAAGGEKAVPLVEHMALKDRDATVGKAATQALGRVKTPGGLAALARIYERSAAQRQTAGIAIVGWGGDAAADTLARLAFEAPPDARRGAVALLFSLGRNRDDPRLVSIRTTHPDLSVREFAEEGFDLGTEHH